MAHNPARTGNASAHWYLARPRRNRRSKTCQRRITRGLLPRSHSLTCTDGTADRTRNAGFTGISRLPVPRPVPRPALDRRSPPHYHADSAPPFPGVNAGIGQPSLGYEPYDVRLSRLGPSLMTVLASADLRYEVVPGLLCLPRLGMSRRVSCTNACTNQSPACWFASPNMTARSGAQKGAGASDPKNGD